MAIDLTKKLFIHATNVHQGGGRFLLEALLSALDKNAEFALTIDERMPIRSYLINDIRVKRVKPSVMHRFLAERWLKRTIAKDDVVLSFGNLPPLFRLRGRTIVFLQNRYLVENIPLKGFSLKDYTRLSIERLWLRICMRNVDEFVVQTPTMKKLLGSLVKNKLPIRILPFVVMPDGYARKNLSFTQSEVVAYDFVYVASGEPHKNHQKLFDAWCLLANESLFPSLYLTLDEFRFPELCRRIELMRKNYGVIIHNLGSLPHKDVLVLYKKCGVAIYPSKFESFGLPLIEARQAGLPVLASELDYVRDILDPEQVFDPDSALSIARAVKRFMGVDEKPLPLLDASQFLESLFEWDLQ